MVALREADAEDTLDEALKDTRIEELPSDDNDSEFEDVDSDGIDGVPFPGKPFLNKRPASLPPWLLHRDIFNLFPDRLQTTTSEAQAKTEAECLPLLTGDQSLGLPLNSHGIPHLNRIKHASFLEDWIGELPGAYVAIDASRPWVFYWVMGGLSFMGNDVAQYKQRLMDTVKPLQNSSGGFGGGHGQLSHCAGTYATLLALAAVGGLEVVDRKAMWHFLGQVKQADGGFRMALDAEEDIRGAYCAMTAITLLNLPLELPPDAPARQAGLTSFLDGLGEWVGKCQTYEGGIAGAPTNEAHGAYAFCALACLSIIDAPHISISKYLNVDSLLSWLTGIQNSPEGGFAGRTNKLVDACYSHWVGGCWALIQAAIAGPNHSGKQIDLWSRAGLVRYLLCCGQQPGKKGGMRDKPSTRPDAYHTCYSLAGLSAAMNYFHFDTKAPATDESGRRNAAFQWTAETPTEEERQALAIDVEDLVLPVHPVFVLPLDVVEKTRVQFQKGGFRDKEAWPS
ncbi:Putative terpenoid cyclases/protein prenyltransferase alpha-alpha toroid [Septoria linicola]|uniref:Terpenoid cyclases/protein prenyltransferase alpha-alpha toroid n=1 Tax=Septoria linicola TaxID=215465 RepID=A0A9Q9ATN9_9PEZI|nr:putative terpenoid cyclases/protein prenyltransferase alpha-alpha toroid [Septoria linicola]USW52345.1 Putative terpenoid cyclases/protein prenyltransferase alpha-alpha toroid [Septoria linicola]